MGLGLQGAYGLSALQQMIRQRIADQLAQKQQDFQNQIALRGADRADAQLAETSAFRRAQEAETTRQHDLTAADRNTGLANTLADQLPAGAALAPTDPAVGLMTKGGRGSLLTHEAPTMASESLSGFSSLPGGPKPVTGVLRRASDAAQPERYIKQASAKQQDTQADNARQADALVRQREADAQRQRHELAMEKAAANKPPAMITVQTVDENGQPITKIVPKTAGSTFVKGPSATTQNRLDSALAVKQTGEDMIAQLSDPAFKNTVGPAMGRANTLRDFIGNPPPEFAKLAGQIESYAFANMGVHGMRSTQGAEKISKLLDKHHTPESLIEAIRGLSGFSEHFLANAGRTTGGGGKTDTTTTKPTAADLIKKYGG